MKLRLSIWFFLLALFTRPGMLTAQSAPAHLQFDFCGEPIQFDFDLTPTPALLAMLTQESILAFYDSLNNGGYRQVVKVLREYKEKQGSDDWLFYQLIRQTAQHISPKANNYVRYTLFKWFFLSKTGYDAILTISKDRVLFYTRCDENIYNIPHRIYEGKQYVCLNYHDYGKIDFEKDQFETVAIAVPGAEKVFSYKIRKLPEFRPADYRVKDLHFSYNENDYHFKVKLNTQVRTLFNNYPAVDYESYLNIPLSRETYRSLIPMLKKNIKGMSKRNGVDYLMRFTRYAFLFERDTEQFGSEKRLSPEQTLLYEQSDCEDRVALFFCLVKEIYDLPMIVLSYPNHVTIAVQFDKPVGNVIVYNGNRYSICEPTPQKQDLLLGQSLPELSKVSYEVAYVYIPQKK